MSELGTFGGSAPEALRVAAGGSPEAGDLMKEARDRLSPTPEGTPAATQQVATDAITTRRTSTAVSTALADLSSWTDLITITFTPTTVSDLLLLAGTDVGITTYSSGTFGGQFRLLLDGVAIDGGNKESSRAAAAIVLSSVTIVVLSLAVSAASHTFLFQGRPSATGLGTITATGMSFTIAELKR